MAIKQDALVKLAKELSSVLEKPVTRSIKNRIAYIVSHGASYASNGYAVRTQGVAKALNEHGYETLCMVRPGRPWELDKDTTIGVEEIVDGVRYIHSGNDKDFIAAKAEAHLKQSAEYFKELFYVYRPEYVIAASDFKIGLPALIAAKQLGIPFFNEVRGFWEMSRIAREPEYERTNSYKRQIERDTFVAQQANAVFTLSETMRTELAKRGVDKQKVHLVPNGVSKLPEPKGVNTALRNSLGIQPGEKVIGFIGSINAYEGLDTLVAACQKLIDRGQKIKLLLVGDSQPLDNVLGSKFAEEINKELPWLIQVGRVAHEKVGEYYSLVEAIVIPRKRLPVCETVPPMKAAEAIAYGKKLIVSDVRGMQEYVDKYEGVFSFAAENLNELTDIIANIHLKKTSKPHKISLSNNVDCIAKALKVIPKNNRSIVTKKTARTKKLPRNEITQQPQSVHLLETHVEFELSKKDPVWYKVKVSPGQKIIVRAATEYFNISNKNNRKAVLLINSFDSKGKLVDKNFGKMAKSGHLNAHFKYLGCTDGSLKDIHIAVVPQGIFEIAIGCCGFNLNHDERVLVKELNIHVAADESRGTNFIPPTRQAAEISLLGWPEPEANNKPLVIGIMDEFTTGCFESDVNLIQPRPDNWYALAEKYNPAFIFIESAWKGNFGSWQYRVADYANKPGYEIAHICQYAREKGIPTLFWNKEDPVHHQKFMCSARLVDHIFTTDANMKSSYVEKTGNSSVHALPFAAQPSLHKPAPLKERKHLSCFAGSWYGNRHAERGESMKWLLKAANKYGLEIYDRNYGTGIFPFPDEYQEGIKGSIPYKELCEEYNRYRIFINVNSVTDSPTMFSRRVFELMACGTPVVSTYAKGIETLFDSNSVWLVNTPEEAEEAFYTLMNDDEEWRRRSLAGIREVFSKHTYAHRLNDIFVSLKLDTRIPTDPKVALVVDLREENELGHINKFIESQSYKNFRVFVVNSGKLNSLVTKISSKIELIDQSELLKKLKYSDDIAFAGRIDIRNIYGEHYLRDLINATLFQPSAIGWAKSAFNDEFSFNKPIDCNAAIWLLEIFISRILQPDALEISGSNNVFVIDSDQYDSSSHQSINLIRGKL